MTVRLGVTGATGRMGRTVLAAAADREDCAVVLAVTRDPNDETVAGVAVEDVADFEPLLTAREPDVVVDFTGHDSAVAYADTCADVGVAFVTGTTGFDDDGLARLDAASEAVPVLHAPNFSRGAATLEAVVGEAVRRLPGYDVELVEAHHGGKRDAPSGTANRLLDAIEENGTVTGRTHGREGDALREPGEIGVHSLRAGDVTGEHEVRLAGDHEELRLTHRVGSRGVFAAGALDAATWLAGRDPGRYAFGEVIGE